MKLNEKDLALSSQVQEEAENNRTKAIFTEILSWIF